MASPTEEKSGQRGRRIGLLLAGVAGGGALAVSLVALPFVTPALRRVCIPYVPATRTQLANLMAAIARTGAAPSQLAPLVDLGSGDGRVVLECAKKGISSVGVELNLVLVLYSKWQALLSSRSLSARASFVRRDLFKTDLSPFNSAVIFGAESLMDQLVPKMAELRGGSRVFACRFPLPASPHFRLVGQVGEGIDAVWIYERGEARGDQSERRTERTAAEGTAVHFGERTETGEAAAQIGARTGGATSCPVEQEVHVEKREANQRHKNVSPRQVYDLRRVPAV